MAAILGPKYSIAFSWKFLYFDLIFIEFVRKGPLINI